jgi:hypothetical protein
VGGVPLVVCHIIAPINRKIPHFREEIVSSTLIADSISGDDEIVGFFGISY